MTAPRHFHQAVAAAKAGIRKGDSVTRPTADIVADLSEAMLRSFAERQRLCIEAADRLAELDAEWQTLCRVAHATALFQGGAGDRDPVVGLINVLEMGRRASDELERIDALRPDCPTCGGRGTFTTASTRGQYETDELPCPDCLDGKVSVAQLAATWRAVWDDGPIPDHFEGTTREYLREVKP